MADLLTPQTVPPTTSPASAQVFCTYFDSRYAARGLAMVESLCRVCPGSTLTVLCLDAAGFELCRRVALPGVALRSLADLEAADPDLPKTRSMRSLLEYYFTCTPALVLHLLQGQPPNSLLTYIDADLFFFGAVDPLFAEFGDASVGIIDHRFGPRLQHMLMNGRFNVGWLTFRHDANALACLRWWRERCLEWCYDRIEDDRFADQKYLDRWPERFRGVRVLDNPGANVAFWNLGNHPLRWIDGRVIVGEQPLIFYHYHGLRRLRPWLYDTRLRFGGVRWPGTVVRRHVYRAYLTAVRRWESRLAELGVPPAPPLPRVEGTGKRPALTHARRLLDNLLDGLRLAKALPTGQLVYVPPPGRRPRRQPEASREP